MANRPQRLVFAYRPEGFRQIGGLQRIARELVTHLQSSRSKLSLATFNSPSAKNSDGILSDTMACYRLQANDHLLIVGCDSPWAYGLALRARLMGLEVSWLPSFHDPASTIHQRKARVAQLALQAIQTLGVVIYVQTNHEYTLLRHPHRPDHCRLSGHGMPAAIRQWLLRRNSGASMHDERDPNDAPQERPIDLLFLGRPTSQKGWNKFIEIAKITELRCEAIVPYKPETCHDITLHVQPSDAGVQILLHQSKVVLIPANYESFGIGQLEGLVAGCAVPILGHWPLWDKCEALRWQSLDPAQLAENCKQLCSNPSQSQQLRQQQLKYLCQHPVLKTPLLPGLP